MPGIQTSYLRELVKQAVGPAPWYWQTFPTLDASGQKLIWQHHGEQGPLGYLVSLHLPQEPDSPRLALNTYCRPFLVPPSHLGVWCPEGRSIRLVCFDPVQLKAFDFAEIAGWFKQSSERIYSATEPMADFEVPAQLADGVHKIDVPPEMRTVEELILPTMCAVKSNDEPAMALYVVRPGDGSVEVLPQKWFTRAQYDVGYRWITRVVRDPESRRLAGECYGVGTFLLEEDGCRLADWIERRP